MKKSEVPNDPNSPIAKLAGKEVCYALDEDGNYVKVESSGWEVKSESLYNTFEEIESLLEEIKEKIKHQELSPIAYWMEKKLMDFTVLKAYTGIAKWRIKRHLKFKHYRNLSPQLKTKYANAFEINIKQLDELI